MGQGGSGLGEGGQVGVGRVRGEEPVREVGRVVEAVGEAVRHRRDLPGRAAGWKRFGKNDPVWQKFRSMHEYDDKEIVSKITNKVLIPTAYSQL